MKDFPIQQEILLVAHSKLVTSQLCSENSNSGKSLNEMDELENLLWFGLFDELLPDLFIKSSTGAVLYRMYIHISNSSYQFGLSESFTMEKLPPYTGIKFSIDPYIFLSVSNYN
jgi:hypothetical protein